MLKQEYVRFQRQRSFCVSFFQEELLRRARIISASISSGREVFCMHSSFAWPFELGGPASLAVPVPLSLSLSLPLSLSIKVGILYGNGRPWPCAGGGVWKLGISSCPGSKQFPFLELASAWGQAFLLIGIVRPAKPEGLSEWPGGGCGMYSLQGFRHGCFILDSTTAKLVWCCCMSHDEPFKCTCNGEMFYSSWECLGAAQLRGCN